MSLTDQIFFQNQHWEFQLKVPSFHRNIFEKLISNLNNKFILSINGPRRVGKTTLLKQLINYLIMNGTDKHHILYFSLDIITYDLLTIYNTYLEEFSFSMNDRCILIFDEIQYLNNWASHVKLLYDNLPNSKIIISSSSSLDLRRGKESLAGREIELFMPPLSFKEYLMIKNISPISNTKLWHEYLYYMDHQLPELISNTSMGSISEKEYIFQLVDKILTIDMVRLHGIRDITPLISIFRIICKSPGSIIIIQDLSNELNIDVRTVQKYLKFLEQSLLIRKLYNYSTNPRKSENRHKRYYPFFTTLHWYTYPHAVEFGKKVKTEVAFQLSAEYFLNDRGKEIDFIVGNETNIAVDVQMRNVIKKKHIRTLINRNFSKKYVVVAKQSITDDIKNLANVIPLHKLMNIEIS